MSLARVLKILVAAREKISVRSRWTKYAVARDANGRVLPDARLPEAVSWCAIGAIQSTGDFSAARSTAMNRLDEAAGHGTGAVAWFNDQSRTSHPAILRVFDKAIRKLKREMKKK